MIKVTATPTVCLRKVKGSLRRMIEIKVKNSSAAEALEGELLLGKTTYPVRFPIPRGESRHQMEVDEPDRPSEITVRPTGRYRFAEERVSIAPQRPWDVYLLHHSHNDLGYTELPALVVAAQADYIDRAIQYCRDTASYPKDARFRWNLEGSWQLRNYVNRRPTAAVDALVSLMKEGRIETSAWYLNMTDVGNVEETLRAHYFVADFCRRYAVPLRAAMSCDVNGYPWCLPTVLRGLGVDRMLSALNTTRSISPLDRPCAFRWESPDGARVLVWHGEHYHFGNHLGLVDGRDFLFERLTEHLRKLEHKGYDYPMALIQLSGTYSDNAPPNHNLSDFVRSWNRRWRSPRMRLTTVSEWFTRLEKELGDGVPVYRQAWPDYWADGLASAPIETSLARRARRTVADAEAAHSALHLLGRDHQPLALDTVYEETTFANEHTFGYHSSVSHPFHPQSLAHWNHKAGFFYRGAITADSILRESGRSLTALIRGGDEKRIAVHNRLSWARGGLVEVAVPMVWLPELRGFRIMDTETDGEIPYQVIGETRRELRIALEAPPVPAFGYRVFTVDPGAEPAVPPQPEKGKSDGLENDHCRVDIDRSGSIGSWWHKILQRELVNQVHAHRLGQLISETIIHEEGRAALNGWWFYTHRNKSPEKEIFARQESSRGRLLGHQQGRLFSEAEIEARNPALSWQRTSIRLIHGDGAILLSTKVRKPLNTDPEALYLAFPFDVPAPTIWFDAAGGPFRPGEDQIQGSCMDFYTLQDWALIGNGRFAVIWIPLDAPLVQVNGITTAKWIRKVPSHTGTIYSWPYNNYWTTNFPVTACGDFEFRYLIRALSPAPGFAETSRIAAEAFSPLEAHLLTEQGEGALPPTSGSLFEIEPSSVQAIALKPHKEGNGFVLRLQEKEGKEKEVCLRFHLLRPAAVKPVDLLEMPQRGTVSLKGDECRLRIPPFGIRTLNIVIRGDRQRIL